MQLVFSCTTRRCPYWPLVYKMLYAREANIERSLIGEYKQTALHGAGIHIFFLFFSTPLCIFALCSTCLSFFLHFFSFFFFFDKLSTFEVRSYRSDTSPAKQTPSRIRRILLRISGSRAFAFRCTTDDLLRFKRETVKRLAGKTSTERGEYL